MCLTIALLEEAMKSVKPANLMSARPRYQISVEVVRVQAVCLLDRLAQPFALEPVLLLSGYVLPSVLTKEGAGKVGHFLLPTRGGVYAKWGEPLFPDPPQISSL